MKKVFKTLLMITCFCLIAAMTVIGVVAVELLPGDVNGDGRVNLKDVVTLSRYIAGWDVEVNEALLDVNGDGVVDSSDVDHLFKYAAGWQGITIHFHTHEPEYTAAKEATVTQPGNIAHYFCASCNKYFSDAECTQKIDPKNIVIPATGSEGLVYSLNDDGLSYEVDKIGTCTDAEIFIPEVYRGLPVTKIGNYAFYNCSFLTSITIPESVTFIDEAAFVSCKALSSVTLSEGITHLGENAFDGCSSLTTIVLPDSIKTIDPNAFSNCSSLVSVDLPEGITAIPPRMFSQCDALAEVNIPEGVTSIGENAFYLCKSLKNVILPSTVTSIGLSAFDSCEALTDLKIPTGITSIGYEVFYGCSNLVRVYYDGTEADFESSLIAKELGYLDNEINYYFYSASEPTVSGNFWHYVDGVPTVWENHVHTEVIIASVPATCTETGLTEGKRCSVCEKITVPQQEIAALGHSGDAVKTVAPLCSSNGYTEKQCKTCGITFMSEPTLALGHSFGKYVTVREPGCDSLGLQESACSVCGAKDEVSLPALGHSYDSTAILNGEFLYKCQICGTEKLSAEYPDTYGATVGIVDCPVDYSFTVVSSAGVADVLANIKVINTYFAGSEYENEPGTVPTLNVTSLGNNEFLISPASDYESGMTYEVTLSGDTYFKDYTGRSLRFTIEASHTSEIVYNDKIIFILLPELGNPERELYLFETITDSESVMLYMPNSRGLSEEHIGRIICVGDYNSVDEILADSSKQCDFGKIKAIYWNSDGSCRLELVCPELDEIFDILQISESGRLIITDEDLYDNIEDQAAEALLSSDDFAEFMASATIAARSYASSRGVMLADASERAILEKLKLVPTVKTIDGDLYVKITGKLPIDLKTSGGKKYGSITLTFEAESKISLDWDLEYEWKKFWGIPIGFKFFDFHITQNADFSFTFDTEIKIDHTLDNDIKINDIYKTPLGIYHLKDCTEIYMYNPENLPAYSYTEAGEIYKENWGYVSTIECKKCRPFTSYLNGRLFFVNTSTNTLHRFVCDSGDRFALAGGELLKKLPGLASYTYCTECTPQKAEIFDFDRMMLESLKSENWKSVVEKVKQIAKDNGVSESSETGKRLLSIPCKIYIFSFNVELNLELSFKFEGSVKYSYACETSNTFGIRLNHNSMLEPYVEKHSKTTKHSITLVGEADFKIGLDFKLKGSFIGLNKFAYIDIYADAGIYSDLQGIVKASKVEEDTASGTDTETKSESYSALYLEIGVYLDVGFEYKVFAWGNKLSFLGGEKRIPLLAFGYDKVYYSFSGAVESLKSYETALDLKEHNLLSANCFSAKSMKSNLESLNILGEAGKYSVDIKLLDSEGNTNPYCTVSNGVITVKEGAPCTFDVTVVIDVIGKDDAIDTIGEIFKNNYVAGSNKYSLDDYTFTVSFENHRFSEWTVLNAPTCTEGGTEYRYYICECVENNSNPPQETRPLDPLGHQKIIDKAVKVTCTTDGYTEGSHCDRCKEIFVAQQLIPMLGHKYADPFTCHDRACLNNGCDYVDPATTDHKFSKWVTMPVDECLAEPISFRYCTDCLLMVDQNGSTDIVIHGHDLYFAQSIHETCTEPGLYVVVCRKCEKEILREAKDPTGHDLDEYQFDSEGHYQTCKTFGCNYSTEKVEHIFINNCDKDCNVCKYERSTTHTWGEYISDEDYHWLKCNICSALGDKIPHSGGTATCEDDAKCQTCGTVYEKALNHNFNQQVVSEIYFASEATCTKKATYYYSCERCGAAGTDTFEYGKTLEHTYKNEYTANDEKHWRGCINCSNFTDYNAHSGGKATCTEKAVCEVCLTPYGNTLPHTGGTASCIEKAVCDLCGTTYGKLADHINTKQILTEEYLKSEADCQNEAVYYYVCEVCGEKSNETFKYGIALGHLFGEKYLSDNTNHWHQCERCTQTADVAAHIGGTATCTEKAVCDICGSPYGSLADHIPTKQIVSDDYLKSRADCLNAAVYYYACELCEVKCDKTYEYGNLLGHDFADKYSSDNSEHWRKCKVCDEKTDVGTHIGGTATCTEKAKCSVCGVSYGSVHDPVLTKQIISEDYIKSEADCLNKAVYYYACELCGTKGDLTFEHGEALNHTFDDRYSSDNTEHWRKCIHCAETTDRGEHSGGTATCTENAKCIICEKAYGTVTGHIMTKQDVAEKYRKSEADCLNKAVYYYSCELCGEKGDNTFEHGEALDHTFAEKYLSDATNHWRKCIRCNETTDNGIHTGGNTTCTEQSKCSVCGALYGTVHDPVLTKQIISEDYIKSEASCLNKAVYYYACELCNSKGDLTFEYGEALGHTFGDSYLSNNTHHWRKCIRCDETTDNGEHGGFGATCTEKAVCMICNMEYGETVDHSFTLALESDEALKRKATCEKSGIYYYSCIACGKVGTETFETDALGHEWSTNYSPASDGSGHHRICVRSGCGKEDEVLQHLGGTAQCTVKPKCDVCGASYGSALGHLPTKQIVSEDLLQKKADCLNKAVYYYSCERCDSKTSETFEYGDPLGHDPRGELYYNENGHYYMCDRCDSVIELIAHSMSDYVQTSAPSCSESGSERSDCDTCDYYVTRDIAKLEHELIADQGIVIGPDKDGYYIFIIANTCANCSYYEEIVRSTAHVHQSYELIIGTPATCTEAGLTAGLICSEIENGVKCGEILIAQETIAPLDHIYANGTCINCGKSEYESSQGLEFTLNSDGQSYSVTGIGTCTDTDIVIPATYNGLPVTSIGSSAFSDCSSLTSITIPNTITSIGNWTFYGCSSLTSITIPNNVTSIGESAFTYCTSLTSITIPNSVTSIGDWAFGGCSSLTSITIPEGVTSIGENAFYGCSSFTSINIPNSVTSIGPEAFAYCARLESIVVEECNTVYHSYNNCLIETASKTLIAGCKNSVIPTDGSITSIGNSAFMNCSSLTSINIPNSVTSIEKYAFFCCSSLTSIAIPEGVTSIGHDAFYGCSSFTSITIPEGVTSIGSSAFWNCKNLSTFIFDGTAEEWEKVKKGTHWNYGCPFTEVIFTQVNASQGLEFTLNSDGQSYSVTGIGTCTDTDIVIPATYNGLPVTSIKDYAFQNCQSLTSVNIPNSVTSIGGAAFRDCSNLTSINIPTSVTSIGNYAFSGCSSLININIPNNVTIIGTSTFSGCSSLTSINIPNNVTRIGDWAFSGCSSLTSITIPEGVTSIGENAFYDCSSLTSINIPNSVTSIGSEAFAYCARLKSIVVEEGNTVYHSYNNCLIETASKTLIAGCKNSIIPTDGSVTSIGNSAFMNCSSLTSINIPNSVTSIGDYAFEYCKNLSSFTFDGTAEEWEQVEKGEHWNYKCPFTEVIFTKSSASQGLEFTLNSDGQSYSVAGIGTCTDTEIVIPTTYNGLPVTSIGYEAFKNCSKHTSVNIPSDVTSIGNYAFYGCSSLISINIPNGVKSIGDYAFESCSSLTNINIPNSVTSIGREALCYCSSLTSIAIPNSVTSIGNSALSGCSVLESIVVEEGNPIYHSYNNCLIKTASKTLIAGCKNSIIPTDGSVTSIGNNAFHGCSSLTNINIPNSVTSIEQSAFCGCSNLVSINIPNSVTSISEWTFKGCSSLTSISIPDSVKTVEWYAFLDCIGLTSVTVGKGVETVGSFAFQNCSSLKDVYINDLASWVQIDFVSWNSNPLYNGCKLYINGELATEMIIPNGVTSICNRAFAYCTSIVEVVLPNSTTSIGNNTFDGCSNLTSINIPNSVTSIGANAFYYCSSLTSINIPNSVTSIGNSAFTGCSSLTSINIPNSVTSIGSVVFYDCSGLTNVTIPNSVTSIGSAAFYGCQTLYYFTFDGTVEEWEKVEKGTDWNKYCPFTEVIFTQSNTSQRLAFTLNSDGQSYSVTGVGTFTDTEIVIPATYEGLPVTSIGYEAFKSCSRLTSITIPNSVTSIGNSALSGCSALESIVVEEGNPVYHSDNNCLIKTQSKALMAGCKNSVIPTDGSVTVIGNYAFANCSSLTSISIPNNVTSIAFYAFYYCSGLTNITISNSVTSIGSAAFYGCKNLSSFTFDGTAEEWEKVKKSHNWNYKCPFTEVIFTKSSASQGLAFTSYGDGTCYVSGIGTCSDTDIVIPSVSPAGDRVIDIGPWAFVGDNIISIEIPSSVIYIEYNAFDNCSKLERVSLSTELQSIGSNAFENCVSLKSITIPETVTFINLRAFKGCASLTDVNLLSENATISSSTFEGCDNIEYNEYDNACYLGNAENPYVALIKAKDTSITSCTVNSTTKIIAEDAFENCESAESIILPNGLRIIGARAFSNCSSLTNIEIPDTVTLVDWAAFAGNTSLSSITIPFIGNYAVNNDDFAPAFSDIFGNDGVPESLKKVTVTGGNTIPEHAFARQKNIQEIVISDGIQTIDEYAFNGCTGLKKITIGSDVTFVGYLAFSNCYNLTEIHIQDIASWCSIEFESLPHEYTPNLYLNGTLITNLVIPEGVEYINYEAFMGCTNITTVSIPAGVEYIYNAFAFCTNLTKINYAGTMLEWQELVERSDADYWNEMIPHCTVVCSDGQLVYEW